MYVTTVPDEPLHKIKDITEEEVDILIQMMPCICVNDTYYVPSDVWDDHRVNFYHMCDLLG